MSTSRLDAVYRSITISKFFTKGWGKPENLKRLFEFRKVVSNRDECFKLVERDYPVTITKEQTLNDCKLLEGYFLSPLERHLPGIVPEIAQKAHFQVMLPLHWQDPNCKPVCLHLAGTGDHFFWRRRNLMVKPLLKEACIGGIILENPFYGFRKPTDQIRSSLHNVSDIFVMGGCLMLESLVLFHWCERNGLGPLGITGLSMGGHMASLAATNWPKPLVLVPCLSWSTASAVFLQGVLSHSINWDLLEDQYLSDGIYREKLSKMVTIVDEAFLAGKKFARTYSQSMGKPATSDNSTANINTVNCDNTKNLDITYKEPSSGNTNAQDIVDVAKTVEINNNKSSQHVKSENLGLRDNLINELRKLLEEEKISKQLYDKLSSNEKFELNPEDIGHLNQLHKEDLKELLLKLKIAQINNAQSSGPSELKNNDEKHVLTDTTNVSCASTIVKTNSTDKTLEEQDNSDPSSDKENQVALTKEEKKSWHVTDITSDIWMNLPNIPFIHRTGKKIDISKIHWRDREALQFMRGIMDECTHLSNFSVPYDTSLIIAVCAKHDAYVPREDVGTLEEIWPGAEVRYVDAGHVTAYILHQSLFRSCIKEAFERSKKKWTDGKHIN